MFFCLFGQKRHKIGNLINLKGDRIGRDKPPKTDVPEVDGGMDREQFDRHIIKWL